MAKKNQKILIRTASLGDAKDLTEIRRQPKVYSGTMQLPYNPIERATQRLEQALKDPDNYILVAEIGKRVRGNLGLYVEKNPRRRHAASIGMMVHDKYQGQGVGGALLKAAIDLADLWLNLKRLELTVYTDNKPAIALYQKLGFKIEGTLHSYAFREGCLVDAFTMARLR